MICDVCARHRQGQTNPLSFHDAPFTRQPIEKHDDPLSGAETRDHRRMVSQGVNLCRQLPPHVVRGIAVDTDDFEKRRWRESNDGAAAYGDQRSIFARRMESKLSRPSESRDVFLCCREDGNEFRMAPGDEIDAIRGRSFAGTQFQGSALAAKRTFRFPRHAACDGRIEEKLERRSGCHARRARVRSAREH